MLEKFKTKMLSKHLPTLDEVLLSLKDATPNSIKENDLLQKIGQNVLTHAQSIREQIQETRLGRVLVKARKAKKTVAARKRKPGVKAKAGTAKKKATSKTKQ